MRCKNGKPVLRPEDNKALAKTSGLSQDEVEIKSEAVLKDHPDIKLRFFFVFREMMSQALPKKDSSKLKKHVFPIYDNNGDFVEFILGFKMEAWRMSFRVFDVNSDR